MNLGTIRIRAVDFSPDGEFIAVASYDNLRRLWEWGLGQTPLGAPNRDVVLRGHTGLLVSISYRPDGQLVATGSTDGTARIWRTQRLDKNTLDKLSTKELLAFAETRPTRKLTSEKKAIYLGE